VESVLVPILVLLLLAAVVWVVSQPLRGGVLPEEDADAAQRAELEAEKAAKYREIRDADLDHRTGKLDDADWRAIDRQLRAEAVELLRRLDALGADAAGEEPEAR
jgi:Na+-transporting methylmalonyl-CoA/oxaloacetate decarboxylase gamma subunit